MKRLMYFTVGQPLFISPLFSTISEKLYRDLANSEAARGTVHMATYRPDFLNVNQRNLTPEN
jgi:protein involved in temperature-dependent protein secretion